MNLKKLSIVFTLVLTFSTFFSSLAFAENMDKPHLVALGDSITYGYKLEDTQSQASPNAFPSLIANRAFDVTNLGFPGWTSTHLLTAYDNDVRFSTAIKEADVITLDIGSNDLLGVVNISEILASDTPVNREEIEFLVRAAAYQLGVNLEELLSKIRMDNPEAPVILYNIYNPFGETTDPNFQELHLIGEQIVTSVNAEVIFPFTQFPGIYLADAYTAYSGNQAEYIFGLPKDLIHPNAAGHQALADLATEIILSLVPEETELELNLSAIASENNESVTIEVTTNAEEILELKWLPGVKTVDDFKEAGIDILDNRFEVTENSSYTVYIVDGKGKEALRTITIETIIPPTEKPDPVETPDPTDEQPAPTPKPSPVKTPPGKGHPLPNTASPAYNYVAAGSTVLLAGFIVMSIQRKRRKEV